MKQKIIPLISLLVGILAFVLTYQYLRGKERDLAKLANELRKGAQEIDIVVANHDIPRGVTIKKSDLSLDKVFQTSIHSGAVLVDDFKMILGKKSLFKIKRRDPIYWTYFEGGRSIAIGLASTIPEGMRAISLPIGGAPGVSGHVNPKDHVDVLGTFSFPSEKVPGEMETVTLTVLQNVTVLAAGKRTAKSRYNARTRGSSSYSTVTLSVFPHEAEILTFAQNSRGQLSLVLRNRTDVESTETFNKVNFEHLQEQLPKLNRIRQRKVQSGRNL